MPSICANFAPAGFSGLRTADNTNNVFAGQPLTGPAGNYLYGIGQTAGSFVAAGITPIGFPDPTSDAILGSANRARHGHV